MKTSSQLTPGQARTGRTLWQSGCIIAMLYFWSGLLHAILGSGVYVRDVLLLGHLGACLFWFYKTGQLKPFLSRNWLVVAPGLFLLPALANGAYRVEALTFLKWTAIWMDWIALGGIGFVTLRGFEVSTRVFLLIAALLLLGDAVTGFYEVKTEAYVLQEHGRVSAFGVEEVKEQKLQGLLRVKGLQRDVFSYANLMGMSMVAGLLVFVMQESLYWRVASMAWVFLFAGAVFLSGGRSAFFGILAAGLVGAGLVSISDFTRRHFRTVVLVWLVLGLIISVVGVGRLTESVGGSVMKGSRAGDSDSAYMRDAAWAGIFESIKNVPIIVVTGAPVVSFLETNVDPIYHWADNQYLWLLYHASLAGLLAPILYFNNMLRLPPDERHPWVRDALVLFLLYVMGEAIARESMTFLGCLPLFLACGWQGAADGEIQADSWRGGGRVQSSPSPKSAKGRSESSDFARRIREASRAKRDA